MRARPIAVLAMAPALTPDLFTPEHHARLATLAELPDPQPLTRFDDARAAPLLARAEILLTAWGSPRIDAAVLARAPRLAAIIHAAGTVKGHVDPLCFERGVRVSSAAAANAVPVAEFTLAAILLAGKRAFRLQRRYARGAQLPAVVERGAADRELPQGRRHRGRVADRAARAAAPARLRLLRARQRSVSVRRRGSRASAPRRSTWTTCCAAPTW